MMSEKAVDVLTKYIGTPYKHMGRDFDGLDCYGLILKIFNDISISLPDVYEDYTPDFAWKGKDYFLEQFCEDWIEVDKPQFLDVVAFKTKDGVINHAGVMLDEYRFIHCCRAGTVCANVPDFAKKYHCAGYYRYKRLA